MVHYIRFLKVPVVSQIDVESFSVATVITITTDLGEVFFPRDVELTALLVGAVNADTILAQGHYQWNGGQRAMKCVLSSRKILDNSPLRLRVSARHNSCCLSSYQIPKVLDAWSAPFTQDGHLQADPLVERQLQLSDDVWLKIWEETGNSIARHIW